MSRRIRFVHEASAEIEEAARWYEAQRQGLGVGFLTAVDRAVEAIGRWPEAGAPVEGMPAELRVRRVPIGRFPHYVAYLVTAEAIHVLAVAHERRRPRYWTGRTGEVHE